MRERVKERGRFGRVVRVLLPGMLVVTGVSCDDQKVTVEDPAANPPEAATSNAEKRVCPLCQRQYFGGERFCMYDQTELVAAEKLQATQKVCPVCGKKYPANKKFCTDDGTPLEEVTATASNTGGGDTGKGELPAGTGQGTGGETGSTDVSRPGETARREEVRNPSTGKLPEGGESSRPDSGTLVASKTPVNPSGSTDIAVSRPAATPAPAKPTPAPRVEPTPAPRPVKSEPTPAPVRPTPAPRVEPTPAPRPLRAEPTPAPRTVKAEPTPAPVKPTPAPRVEPTPAPVKTAKLEPTPSPAKPTPAPRVEPTPAPGKPGASPLKDFDRVSELAAQGKLAPNDIAALERVARTDEDFTKARTLLAMNSKGRNNDAYYRALTDILSVPENKYNPVYNLEMAEYYLLTKRYKESVEQTRMVDRYKQRFPREVYYQRVARMYEVEAKAFEGQFNQTEDITYLEKAVGTWKRFITHVRSNNDADRVKMGEDYVSKLEKIKGRMQ